MPYLEQPPLASRVLTSKWVVDPDTRQFCEIDVTPLHLASLEDPNQTDHEPKYPTGFGNLSFEELYQTTSRLVGFVLRDQVGMTNPEDIDDCMQSGYLKVWEHLQKQPNLFEGKPKRYVVQAVVLRSKAQRYAHIRHYCKTAYDADALDHSNGSGLTTAQIDTWIDIVREIQPVAEYTATLDNPIYLIALYSLITDVKTQDVARTNGYGVSTLTAAKRSVRATLANALPEYGSSDDCVEPLLLPRVRSFHLAQLQKQLISPVLFEDIPPLSVEPRSPAIIPLQKPFSLQPQEKQQSLVDRAEPTYATQWKGKVTLEELLQDTQVRKVVFAKMRSLGYTDEDAQDCFQLGTINLWKTLQKQPDLLSDKGAAWVGIWIAFSGSRRSLWKHKARCTSLDNPHHDLNTFDERGEFYQRSRTERWAAWATRVDQRIDFTLLMNALAQQYADDPVKLFALYSLTTSVKMKDILAAANADKNQLIEARNQVKADIRQRLEIDNEQGISDMFSVDQLQHGQHLECVARVAERVEGNLRLLLALYIVTTSATRKDVTELFGIGITAFRKEMREIKQMLTEEFHQGKRISLPQKMQQLIIPDQLHISD